MNTNVIKKTYRRCKINLARPTSELFFEFLKCISRSVCTDNFLSVQSDRLKIHRQIIVTILRLRRTSTRCTKSTWRASWRTSGPFTVRKWWPPAVRPCSVPFYLATGDRTNRYRYRSKWSCWTRCPTGPWSSCRPATTRTRRPTCETTGPCRPPALLSSTTSGSSAAVEEVCIS